VIGLLGRSYRTSVSLEENRHRESPLWSGPTPPNFPSGESPERNIESLKGIATAQQFEHWVSGVTDQWNYKTGAGGWRRWQDAGNFNYSATGMEVIPDMAFQIGDRTVTLFGQREILLFGAGAYQVYTNLRTNMRTVFGLKGGREHLMPLCGDGYLCDNSDDTDQIQQGMNYYVNNKMRNALEGRWDVPTFGPDKRELPPFRYVSPTFGELGRSDDKSSKLEQGKASFEDETARAAEERAKETTARDAERERDQLNRAYQDKQTWPPVQVKPPP